MDGIADEQVAPSPREPRRFATDSNRLANRLERARVETLDLAQVAVGKPNAAPCERDPDRETADLGARDRTRSRIDAQHLGRIRSSDPDVAAADGESERSSL